MIDFDIFRRN